MANDVIGAIKAVRVGTDGYSQEFYARGDGDSDDTKVVDFESDAITMNQSVTISSSSTSLGVNDGAINVSVIADYGSSKSLIKHRPDVGQLVINEDGVDLRLRVESESDANSFNVFGDTGNTAMGTGTDSGYKLDVNGTARIQDDLTVTGALSKGSGSFRIDHPLEELSETHQLVHSFVEAPQADNIYRGKVELVGGVATINIDTTVGMTEGTFVALNRDVQVFTTNESGFTMIKGSVEGNILTIEAQDTTCTDTISWMAIGERQDKHMYDTGWTDDEGHVIIEPEKTITEEV